MESDDLRFRDISPPAICFDTAFHPTAPLLIAGLINGSIHIYDYSRRAQDDDDNNDDDDAEAYLVDSDGDDDDSISIKRKPRALYHPVCTAHISAHSDSVRAIKVCDGDRDAAVYSASADRAIVAYAINNGGLTIMRTISNAHKSAVNALETFSANIVFTGDDDGFVRGWDMRVKSSAEPMMQFAEHGDYVSAMCSDASANMLISVSGDGFMQVYDVRKAGKWFAQSEGHQDDLLSVAIVHAGKSAERRRIIVGSKETGIHLYKWPLFGVAKDFFTAIPSSIDVIRPLTHNADTSHSSTDLIAVGSADGIIRLITLFPSRERGVLGVHSEESPIESIAINQQTNIGGCNVVVVATAAHDGLIKLFDVTQLVTEDWNDDKGSDTDEEDETQNADADVQQDDRTHAVTMDEHVKDNDDDDGDDDGDDNDDDDEIDAGETAEKRLPEVPMNVSDLTSGLPSSVSSMSAAAAIISSRVDLVDDDAAVTKNSRRIHRPRSRETRSEMRERLKRKVEKLKTKSQNTTMMSSSQQHDDAEIDSDDDVNDNDQVLSRGKPPKKMRRSVKASKRFGSKNDFYDGLD